MVQPDSFDLVVIGGGVVGSVMALLAAREGFTTALVDAAQPGNSVADPRNYAIVRGSWRLLKSLGLTEGLGENTTDLHGLEAEDGGRHVLGTPSTLFADSDLDADPEGEPLGHMVRAHALETLARDAAAAVPGLTRLAPRAFSSATVSGEHIHVRLEDGETLATPLLAGADGMNSPVRAAAGIRTIGWEYDQAVITMDVGLSRSHHGIARQRFLAEGPFALLPLSGDRANLAWYMPRKAAEALVRRSRREVEAELNARHGDWAGTMTALSDPLTYPLRFRVAETMTGARTALLGDAVRRLSPIAGQGLNSGLKDAAALIEIMEEARGVGLDWGRAEFLDKYQRWRRADSIGVALAMDAMTRGFRLRGPLAMPLRSAALGLANAIDPLRKALARQASSDLDYLPRRMRPA